MYIYMYSGTSYTATYVLMHYSELSKQMERRGREIVQGEEVNKLSL